MEPILLISDFNVEPLARYLSIQQDSKTKVEVAPFGQVFQTLDGEYQKGSIIWTLPDRIIPSFARAIESADVDVKKCLDDVSVFVEKIIDFSTRNKFVFVASWALATNRQEYGLLDWRNGIGLTNLLARMNLHLADLLENINNVYLLDASRWSSSVSDAVSPKMWYAAKMPYSNAVYRNATDDIVAAIDALSGRSRKLIIVDLDNTLWGGIVGETGWQGIRLGGHDFIGEAYCDFQLSLRTLSHRGIQLAIVSKNDESVALEAIEKHPEMLLRKKDFSGWRINWHDKAENIGMLVEELNLGLDSVVFIDDNIGERERVRGAFPQVLVPEWPADPAKYAMTLREMKCFNTAAISKEDRMRTAMYVAERDRRETLNSVKSKDDWLKQLNSQITVHEVEQSNISRITQLFNKTNQLNLSTRRLSEKDVLAWSNKLENRLLALAVSDCFGDMGLVGIIGLEVDGSEGRISDFILSCRAMGRRVEQAMISVAVNEMRQLGVTTLQAVYLKTERNRPTLDVLRGVGLEEIQEYLFEYDCTKPYPKPEFIEIAFSPATNSTL